MEELITLYLAVNQSFKNNKLFTIRKHLSFYELYKKDFERLEIDFYINVAAEKKEPIASKLIEVIEINNRYLSELNQHIQQSDVDKEIRDYTKNRWEEANLISSQIGEKIRQIDKYEKQAFFGEILPDECMCVCAILQEDINELENRLQIKNDEIQKDLTPLFLCPFNIIPKLIKENENRITSLNEYLSPKEQALQFFDCFELNGWKMIATIFKEYELITDYNEAKLIKFMMGDKEIGIPSVPKNKTKFAVIIKQISSLISPKEVGTEWMFYILDTCGISRTTAKNNSIRNVFFDPVLELNLRKKILEISPQKT